MAQASCGGCPRFVRRERLQDNLSSQVQCPCMECQKEGGTRRSAEEKNPLITIVVRSAHSHPWALPEYLRDIDPAHGGRNRF